MATMQELAELTLTEKAQTTFIWNASSEQYYLTKTYLYGAALAKKNENFVNMTPEQACYFILIMAAAEGIE